jgi:ferrous iron transport protein A
MTLADRKLPIRIERTILGLHGDDTIVARLRELGFVPGEVVQLFGRAPFGDPLFVGIRGAVIALREEEAACIRL